MNHGKHHALSTTLFLSLFAAVPAANADDISTEDKKAAVKAPLAAPPPPLASPMVVAGPGIGTVGLAHEPKWKSFLDTEARTLVRDAFDLETKGQRFEALELYREAHEKFASAAVDAELGLAELRAGHFVLGLRALDLALNYYGLKLLPRSEQFYKDMAAEAREHVGTINVLVTMPEALVDVDGEEIRHWPFFDRIYVMPGNHEVKAMKVGYWDSHQNVTIGAGETKQVMLALQPTVSREMVAVPVEVPPKGPVQFSASAVYPKPDPRTWPLPVGIAGAIIMSTGGGFLLTGLIAGGNARADLNRCSAYPAALGCDGLASLESDSKMFSNMAIGGGIGMVVGILGVTAAFVGQATAPTPMPDVTITPQFHGKNGTGVGVGGTF